MNIVNVDISEFLEQNVKEITSKMDWMKGRNFRLIRSISELSEYVDMAVESKLCAVDTETNGLNTRQNYESSCKLVGVCLSCKSEEGVYIPVRHKEGQEYNLPLEEVLAEIKRLCEFCVCIFHNSKYDRAVLRNYGIQIRQFDKFEDTQILGRLYDAARKEIGLKTLSKDLLNQPMLELNDVTKNKRFDLTSPRISYVYAASDAVCTFDLFNFFMKQQVIQSQKAIYNLEKRVAVALLDMESNLIKIDSDYLEKLLVKVNQKIETAKKEVFAIVGKEFNLGSPIQLGKILFDELGYKYPLRSKTASGQYSTDNATMEKLAREYPVARKIIEFRGLEKVKGTYIQNLIKNKDSNGCIKLQFNQTGTETGRFSSPGGKGINVDGYCAVNVQSIPKTYSKDDPNIRKAFVSRPGYKFVAMDFKAEELRVAANLSMEPKWVKAFLSGADLHRQTGQMVFGREDITDEERQIGKTLNFQTLYGSGSVGIAQQAGISEREARRILVSFFTNLPQLKKWIDREHARARKLKYVKTAFGRMRTLEFFYNSDNKYQQSMGDRRAVNTLIQGVSADIMKTAMVRVHNWIHKNDIQDNIRILITMHDELVYEIREDKLKEYIPQLYDIMKLEDILQGILKWPVPLEIDVEYGDSWNAKEDFFKANPDVKKSESISFHAQAQITEEKAESEPEKAEPEKSESEPEKAEPEPEKAEPELEKTESEPEKTEPEPEKTEPEKSESEPEKAELEPGKTEQSISDSGVFVYSLNNTRASTCRILNMILTFIEDEQKRGVKYSGPDAILRIKDKKGNSLLVSEMRVKIDAFMALARFYGI